MTGFFENLLIGINQIVGNYGWAVIIFSLLIKAVLLPLDIKSRKSMRAMTALNPKMEELKKRYGNDQEKFNRKMGELYKKNKVSPLSGCLPMLIQLPVLFIMFAAMRNIAAELQLTQMYDWIKANLMDAGEFISLENAQPLLDALRNGDISSFGATDGWLWVKNVFQPDSFSKTIIPTMQELSTLLTQSKKVISAEMMEVLSQYAANTGELAANVDAAIAAHCDYFTFNLLFTMLPIKIPTNWSVYVNGCLILPVLAGVTQVLQTKLMNAGGSKASAAAAENTQSAANGKFMKWFFPIFSVWICLSSTAAFAAYWVFVNVWSIVTNFAINKYLDAKAPQIVDDEKEAIQP
ncbi:MAG: YidC/Oxa1 family membrane protein insertase [Clostridiales bacterium]|nr:YidC/Oxa1 family membrane protein insertase [Clostridiales bacterium]